MGLYRPDSTASWPDLGVPVAPSDGVADPNAARGSTPGNQRGTALAAGVPSGLRPQGIPGLDFFTAPTCATAAQGLRPCRDRARQPARGPGVLGAPT